MIIAAGFDGTFVTEFLEAPFAVVGGDEGGDGGGEFGAIAIGVAVGDFFLERAVGTFDDAVGLGFADEREARREAMEAALAMEVVGEILAAVIVAQFDAAGGTGGARAEDVREGLGEEASR